MQTVITSAPPFATRAILLAANEELPLSMTGSFVTVQEASTSMLLKINGGPTVTMEKGLTYRMPNGARFANLSAINTTGTAQTATLIIGDGEVKDSRLSGAVSIASPGGITTVADVNVPNAAATSVLAANTSRKEAFVSNPAAGADIRVGDSAVGAARGIIVKPGATLIIGTTGQLYVYQASGAAINVPVSYTQ